MHKDCELNDEANQHLIATSRVSGLIAEVMIGGRESQTMAHVFISYSQRDKAKRRAVASILNAADIDTWFDDAGIPNGESLERTIFPALRASKCAVFLLTKHAVRSDWVLKEIQHAEENGIPRLFISFGDLNPPDSFPKEILDIKRIVVRNNFTAQLKRDLLSDVSRIYFEKRAPVVTILNLKGGVGKTTLTANLFGCAHEYDRKSVLIIDLDPQHNLTQLLLDSARMSECLTTSKNVLAMFRGMGVVDPEEITASNVQRVLDQCHVALTSERDGGAKFHLIPGTFAIITYFLGKNHQHFDPTDQPWMNFKRFIAHCRRQYDLIAIDVNPGASLMTEVALSVSTSILSPVRPDRFARYGLTLLDDLLDRVGGDMTHLRRLIILNGVNRKEQDQIEVEMLKELEDHPFPNQVLLKSRIPLSKRLLAKQARPGLSDLTLELAYHGGFGAHAIQSDIRAAASELLEVLQNDQ